MAEGKEPEESGSQKELAAEASKRIRELDAAFIILNRAWFAVCRDKEISPADTMMALHILANAENYLLNEGLYYDA